MHMDCQTKCFIRYHFYYDLMMGNIDEAKKCLKVYGEIEKDKAQVARAYNNEMNIIIGWRSDLEDNSTSHDEGQ